MIKSVFLHIVFISFGMTVHAQTKWFHTYTDSAALVTDATEIVKKFKNDINNIDTAIVVNPTVILNTQPFLIFYSPKSNKVNLPLWQQLSAESKNFFITLSGSEKKGQELFGLFFNGFYLPHELGHALQKTLTRYKSTNSYESEYLANILGMLWWRKQGKHKELKKCYKLAKKIMMQLKNPVPSGQTAEQYFTENYGEAGKNPFVYGYMQFGQFIKIYEDKSLTNFDTKIKELSKQK
ncbi:MAG: hypothetical protein H0U44_08925 [Flavisolibacter sp.]|jgi:hypothetical protein|nr:hypothetical protein [Flavisolibacter sp.]